MKTEETRNMNRIDEVIARHMHRNDAADEAAAARVLKNLGSPLPRQKHSLFDRWPSLFLTRDYAPAWSRLAATASARTPAAPPTRPAPAPPAA